IMYNVHKKDGTEYLMATVYNANDFDEGCSLLLNLNSIDDVYAVINSIEFTDKTAAAAETIL
ncbi:MAG: hypothetical protein K2N72_03260, partial [Oscillospiraceae bacterium]|nr:hypothetical protein [Oscillospiraceae bacterium]